MTKPRYRFQVVSQDGHVHAEVYRYATSGLQYASYDETGCYGLVYVGSNHPDTRRNAFRVVAEAEALIRNFELADAKPGTALTEVEKALLLEHFHASFTDFENDTLDDWASRHGYSDTHVEWLWERVP